jgi:hypothetical protein
LEAEMRVRHLPYQAERGEVKIFTPLQELLNSPTSIGRAPKSIVDSTDSSVCALSGDWENPRFGALWGGVTCTSWLHPQENVPTSTTEHMAVPVRLLRNHKQVRVAISGHQFIQGSH